jgi:hypothetical protein
VSIFDQAVLFYIDSGQTPTVALDSFFATFGTANDITVIGELIDCSGNVCAPIGP